MRMAVETEADMERPEDCKSDQIPAFARQASFAEQTSAIDEPDAPIGIHLYPLCTGERTRWRVDMPSVVLPVQDRVVELAVGDQVMMLDPASWAVVPARRRVVAAPKSSAAAVLVLSIHPEACDRAKAEYAEHLDRAELDRYLSEIRELPRTTWIHEICHRYLFERSVRATKHSDATRFLETEIVKELYFNVRDQEAAHERASRVEKRPPLVEEAMAKMEAALFEPLSIAALARACHTSPSTLLRAFKRSMGSSPSAYLRTRRLEESVLLLKSRRYTVGEVATRVGYENLAAFSHAFRVRFGKSPTEVTGER